MRAAIARAAALHHPSIHQQRGRTVPTTAPVLPTLPARVLGTPAMKPLCGSHCQWVKLEPLDPAKPTGSHLCWGHLGTLHHPSGHSVAPRAVVCHQSHSIHPYGHIPHHLEQKLQISASHPAQLFLPFMTKGYRVNPLQVRWSVTRSLPNAGKSFLAATGSEQEGETPRAHALPVP